MRQLPVRRWGWLPAGLLGAGASCEIALITMQRWRGEASHFNYGHGLRRRRSGPRWATSVHPRGARAWRCCSVWSLVRFRGHAGGPDRRRGGPARRSWPAGTSGTTWRPRARPWWRPPARYPAGVVFGAAGSAKLAHAAGDARVAGARRCWRSGSAAAGRPTRTQVRVMVLAVGRLRGGVRGGDRHRVRRPGLDLAHRADGAARPGRGRGAAGRRRPSWRARLRPAVSADAAGYRGRCRAGRQGAAW